MLQLMSQPAAPAQTALPFAAGAAHLLPQVLQLYGSVDRLAQVWPQRVSAPQSKTQLPASHSCPVAQTWPQVRQFLASVCRLTHWPLQLTWPAGQQTPLLHVPPQV